MKIKEGKWKYCFKVYIGIFIVGLAAAATLLVSERYDVSGIFFWAFIIFSIFIGLLFYAGIISEVKVQDSKLKYYLKKYISIFIVGLAAAVALLVSDL